MRKTDKTILKKYHSFVTICLQYL